MEESSLFFICLCYHIMDVGKSKEEKGKIKFVYKCLPLPLQRKRQDFIENIPFPLKIIHKSRVIFLIKVQKTAKREAPEKVRFPRKPAASFHGAKMGRKKVSHLIKKYRF